MTERCLIVSVGGGDFGVPLRQLLSVEPMPKVVPVPRVPAWLLGVTYRQGRVLSVVDLAAMVSDGGSAWPPTRLLIAADSDAVVGLAVSSASDVFAVAPEHVSPVPSLPDRPINRYLTGHVTYGEQSFGVLDLTRLMRSPEFLLSE
jgi:purine-binding chemotaxis protein CheW